MNVQKAKSLKVGQKVFCPADRGEKAFSGKVVDQNLENAQVHKNHKGDEYIWIAVQGLSKKSVWPSNRLG